MTALRLIAVAICCLAIGFLIGMHQGYQEHLICQAKVKSLKDQNQRLAAIHIADLDAKCGTKWQP